MRVVNVNEIFNVEWNWSHELKKRKKRDENLLLCNEYKLAFIRFPKNKLTEWDRMDERKAWEEENIWKARAICMYRYLRDL